MVTSSIWFYEIHILKLISNVIAVILFSTYFLKANEKLSLKDTFLWELVLQLSLFYSCSWSIYLNSLSFSFLICKYAVHWTWFIIVLLNFTFHESGSGLPPQVLFYASKWPKYVLAFSLSHHPGSQLIWTIEQEW